MPSCSRTDLILRSTFAIICWILTIFVVFVLYRICTQQNEEKINKCVKRLQYAFIVITICCICANGFVKLMRVHCLEANASITSWVIFLWLLLFAAQLYLLMLIFYIRLKKVFEKTPMELTKCTNRFYMFMFIAIIFVLIVGAISSYVIPRELLPIGLITEMLFLLLVVSLMISLSSLFIYKLIHVYKLVAVNRPDEDLVNVITKMTILATTSISITIINGINTVVINTVVHSAFYLWMFHYISLLDVLTNLICIVINYAMFKRYYSVLCHPLHKCCRLCCDRIISKNDVTKKLELHQNDQQPNHLQVQIGDFPIESTTAGESSHQLRPNINK